MPSQAAFAGNLEHKCSILKPTRTASRMGTPDVTFVIEVAEIWASIEPMSGRELFQAQQANADVSHKITTHFCSGLNSKMRIEYGTRKFNIEWIENPGNRNERLVFYCVEDDIQDT